MAERVTKSYADKRAEIKAKKDALDEQEKKIVAREKEYYPKAGDVLFSVLKAGDIKELKRKWNKAVSEDLKIDEIDCDVDMPKIDPMLAMSNPKKFAKLMKDFHKSADVQRAVAGKTISNVLHVSVLGDLNNKLRELGILNDGLVDEVEEETEEAVEEVSLEEVLASDETMKQDDATDSSTWNPYA